MADIIITPTNEKLRDEVRGRLGQEERADTLEETLDLPVFSDWTLFRLWCRTQGQMGHWRKDK